MEREKMISKKKMEDAIKEVELASVMEVELLPVPLEPVPAPMIVVTLLLPCSPR